MLSGELVGIRALSGEIGRDVVRTGSGGTTNYNNLANKPEINGVELKGDKTGEEFGLASQERVDVVESIAKGAQQAKSFMDYSTLVEVFNGLSADVYKSGQIFNIATTKVPDLWVYGVAEESVPFAYTTDDEIVNLLDTAGVFQVGYYIFGAMETGKVDLTDYAKKEYIDNNCVMNTDIDRMYGIVREPNSNKLTLTTVSNNEMNLRNSWAWSKYRAVLLSNFDYLLKLGLVDNKETLTEEEKAQAQSWLGVPQIQLTQKDNGAYKLTITKG